MLFPIQSKLVTYLSAYLMPLSNRYKLTGGSVFERRTDKFANEFKSLLALLLFFILFRLIYDI